MTGQTLLISINILAGVIAIGLAAFARYQRKNKITLTFGILMVCVAGWAFLYASVHIPQDIAVALAMHKLKHIFAIATPVAWVFFVIQYTGAFRLHPLLKGLLVIGACVALALALSNEQHELLYSHSRMVEIMGIRELVDDIQPLGLLIWLTQQGLLLFGIYLLFQSAMRVVGTSRTQARVILLIGMLIFLSGVLEYGDTIFQNINFTPIALTLSGGLIASYLLGMRPISPIAYDSVIDNLPDAMAVLNEHQLIVTVNPSFLLMFDQQEANLLGQPLRDVVPLLGGLMDRISDVTRVTDTLSVHERSIEAACSPIHHDTLIQGYAVLCRDVTLERGVQDSLIDSERRYRALFDHSNDAIFIFDLKGAILLANQPASALLRAPLSQMLNHPLTDFIKASDVTDLQHQMRRLLSGKASPILEQTIVTADKQEIPVEMSVTLVKDASGAPLNFQMVVRDIRERRRAQTAIAHDRYLLRTLFDSIPDSIMTVDRDGTYTLVNDAHLKRLGLASAEAFIGKTAYDFYDEELAHTLREESLAVIESGIGYSSEELRGHGEWYLVTRIPLHDGDGTVTGLMIVERNIGESKAIQNELQRSLEQLMILRQVDEEVAHSLNIESVSIIALDAALRLSRANAGYIAMAEETASDPASDLPLTNEAPSSDEQVLRVRHIIGGYKRFKVGDALPIDGITGRVIRKQRGQLVTDVRFDKDFISDVPDTVSVMALPIMVQTRLLGVMQLVCKQPDIFTEDSFQFIGLLAYRIAIALDNAKLYEITRHQLEKVQSLNRNLTDLEQIKTDMIRIASHDLKNPLGIIDGYLNMLNMDNEQFDPIYLEYFDAMHRAVYRMNKILSDILSLERVQQRASRTYTTLVELHLLAEKAMEEFSNSMTSHAMHVSNSITDENAIVLGDESQLYEAISNLVSNAIKYTPDGGDIYVRLYEDDNRWIFEVEDTGYGIPEERQQRLFEPFYRAKAQGTEKIDGTGLGLHLVKNIIERHDGEMFFHSTYQKGSLFGFRLPKAELTDVEQLEANYNEQNGTAESEQTNPQPTSNSTQNGTIAGPPNFFED
ncbi:PAS domain-containing protein [Phototrophicus methaneseepsis]|uniref:histidine kinase n=1 Tax=Phototrophicus methaneseepsis TaxID=2710758 RepID=A0A7S8E965_9CHLR|nr:PAS domain-containing protein [Phototrophicus methaneseepsis]QPC82549.1 PAS domain-containing protein [Phototrophicus methaneseepsis]